MSINLGEITVFEACWAFAVTFAIIFGLYKLWEKLYGMYMVAHNKTTKRQNAAEMLQRHEDQLNDLGTKLDRIIDTLDSQDKLRKETNVINFRHDLYKIYEKAKTNGGITREEYDCYMEKERIYTASGGNSFIHDKVTPEIIKMQPL